jgi:secreted trypsin-like serine protease
VATLVDYQWALTAAHCTMETPLGVSVTSGEDYPVVLAGLSTVIDRIVLHPDFDSETSRYADGVDLALLHLRDVQPVAGISLYSGEDELEQTAMLLGWGYSGNGAAGRKTNDGELRRAWNVVSLSGQWLEIQFDDPRIPGTRVLDFEGMPGLGDSGGPALVETDQGLVLIGIARGEMLTAEDQVQGLYGSVAVYERLSLHREWVESVIH